MTGLGFGSSCASGIDLLVEESADGGGSPILGSDDEGGCDWGRRPNEARYDLASLRDGFERKIDMKKSYNSRQDEEQTEPAVTLTLSGGGASSDGSGGGDRPPRRVYGHWTVDQKKSMTKTYRIESLESMGTLRSEGSTGDADRGRWYHGEKGWGRTEGVKPVLWKAG